MNGTKFNNRVNLSIVLSVLLIIAGNLIFLKQKRSIELDYPDQHLLEVKVQINPLSIKAVKNIDDIAPSQRADVSIHITNNTEHSLKNIKFILPSMGLAFLESPMLTRDTSYSQSDIVFNLDILGSKVQKVATIGAYSSEKRVYKLKLFIDNEQRIRANSNEVTLSV